MKLSTQNSDLLYSSVVWTAFIGSAISYSKLYLFHVCVVFAIVHVLVSRKISWKDILESVPSNWFYYYLLMWSSCSLLFVENKKLGILGLLQFVFGLIVIFFWKQVGNKERLIKGLFVLFCVHFFLGLAEAFTPLRWPISTVSSYAQFFGKEATNLPSTYHDYPTGFFWHPNTASFVILFFSPFIIECPKLYRMFRFAFVLLSVIFFIKAGAKAQLILFGLSLVFYFLFRFKKIIKNRKLAIGLGVVSLIVIIAGLYSLNAGQMKELRTSGSVFYSYGTNLVSAIQSGDLSNVRPEIQERFRFIIGAINEFKNSPLFGMGIGQNVNYVAMVNGEPTGLHSVHHYWFELLMIGGLSLFVPFALFILGFYRKYIVHFSFAALASLTLFCIGVISISTAVYFLPQWILYSILSDDKIMTFIEDKEIINGA